MRSVISSTWIVLVRLPCGMIWNMRVGSKGASEMVLEVVVDILMDSRY